MLEGQVRFPLSVEVLAARLNEVWMYFIRKSSSWDVKEMYLGIAAGLGGDHNPTGKVGPGTLLSQAPVSSIIGL